MVPQNDCKTLKQQPQRHDLKMVVNRSTDVGVSKGDKKKISIEGVCHCVWCMEMNVAI